MAKLVIQTQVLENYGSVAKPHWKPKGGNDYVVKKFKDLNRVTEVVMALRGEIEQDNDYCREYILGWEVVADDYVTEFERSQLKYGRIIYPAHELVW